MSNTMVYAWKPGARAPIPAEVAGRELERIRQEQAGFFTPAAVVQASRPKRAPLHSAFEWDDGVAAGKYREDQAKYLIRSIVVSHAGSDEMEARAFVSVTQEEGESPRYTSTERALSDPDLREQVLAAALRDMRSFEKRYAEVTELSSVFSAMHKVSRVVQQKKLAA